MNSEEIKRVMEFSKQKDSAIYYLVDNDDYYGWTEVSIDDDETFHTKENRVKGLGFFDYLNNYSIGDFKFYKEYKIGELKNG
jgi:hypothetical protein